MNISKLFLSAVCTIVVMAIAGCADDELVNENVIKYSGNDIVFGAQAGYEMNGNSVDTRTIYTGKQWTENGKTYEGVNWVAGDMVRIYCAEAVGTQMADYNVTATNTDAVQGTNEHATGLTKTGTVSLQWGDTQKPHTFYAVYPSPYQTGALTGDDLLNGSTTVAGEIPGTQVHKGIVDKGTYKDRANSHHYVLAPDMSYAYMFAKYKNYPNNVGEEVFLKFTPIATAVEITLVNLAKSKEGEYSDGYPFQLASVNVTSEEQTLHGSFTADLNGGWAVDENESSSTYGYPTGAPKIEKGSTGGMQIQMPMYSDGTSGNLLSLGYGDAVTFTVFMLPHEDINDLNVTIIGVGGSKEGKISGITIEAQKKTYLKNVPITPAVLPFTQAEWIKFVEDQVLLSDLSIPGAGGAASGIMKDKDKYFVEDEGKRQQNLDIAGLWNKGIRCFEFATDNEAATLGTDSIICNGVTCNITLDQAIDSVAKQLNAHPDEFAMVILTYQNLGGWGSRTPATYMTKLNNYWPTVASKLDASKGCKLNLYNPSATMTVGEVRGSLFCIARPTSIYQDYGDRVVYYTDPNAWDAFWGKNVELNVQSVAYPTIDVPNENILVIKGWGPLKDKWEQRGYTAWSYRQNTTSDSGDTKPGRAFDASSMYDGGTTHNYRNSVEWNNKTWTTNLPSATYVHGTLAPDFGYSLITSDGELGDTAWVQEWTRVSKSNDYYYFDPMECDEVTDLGFVEIEHKGHNKAFVTCWNNTQGDKIANIKDAMDKSVKKDGRYKIIINSLCGYYVSSNYPQSYKPCLLTDYNASETTTLSAASAVAGLQGDIATFAADMNKEFYNYLQGITTDANGNSLGVGPMGVVLMDRVGDDDYSKLIPGIIVANNFKQSTTTTTPAEDPQVLNNSLTVNSSSDETVTARSLSDSPAEQEMTITWE